MGKRRTVIRKWREEIQNINRLHDLAARNSKWKSIPRFGGKKFKIEIDYTIWREEIQNSNRLHDLAGRNSEIDSINSTSNSLLSTLLISHRLPTSSSSSLSLFIITNHSVERAGVVVINTPYHEKNSQRW